MTAIIVAIIALCITIGGLIVKLTTFTTQIQCSVDEMRKEMRGIKRVPMIEFRLGMVEKHLDISTPHMPDQEVQ